MNNYRNIVYVIIASVLLMAFVYADDTVTPVASPGVSDTASQIPPPPDSAYIARASDSSWWKRSIKNDAFNVGEYLKFKIRYGVIAAGMAEIRVQDTLNYNGNKCFEIVSTARSNAFISTFYEVDDTVISYVDYNGIFSHYFKKKLKEGKYKAEKETFFDQKRHLAITGKDTVQTYSFVQDVFSAFFYARTQTIEPGVDLFIDNHTDKKNYPLKVVVCGRETIEVPAGKFACVVVEPVMRGEGIFQAKGRIKIWLTDDRYKMPVKMETEVFFLGSIHADLVEYRYGVFPD